MKEDDELPAIGGYASDPDFEDYVSPKLPPPSQQDRSVSQPGKEDKIYSQSEMDAAIYNVTELAEFCKNKEFEQYRQQLENLTKENYNLKKSQPSQPGEGKDWPDKQEIDDAGLDYRATRKDDYHHEILVAWWACADWFKNRLSAQPPLPEQGKEEAYGGKEVTILDLVEEKRKLQWRIVDLKDQLAALRAESQAKDTRIRELWTDEQVYAFGGRIYNALAGDYTKEEWSGLDAHFKDFKKNHNK